MKDKNWFIENGCELTRPSVALFLGVYELSHGNPCNGCNCKDTCPAWSNDRNKSGISSVPRREGQAVCPKCNSPLNMKKVERRGWKCACGQSIPAPPGN